MNKINVDMSHVSVDHLYRLPLVMGITDECNDDDDSFKAVQADKTSAAKLHVTKGIPIQIAEEITKIAKFRATWDDHTAKKSVPSTFTEQIVEELERHTLTKELRTFNRSMPNTLASFVSGSIHSSDNPKVFLLRKIRNGVIYFGVLVVGFYLVFQIKKESGLDRVGCLILLSIMTFFGLLNYGFSYRQYAARKRLHSFLLKRKLSV